MNLIGEHVDYSGGLVLPCAIDLGVRVDGAPAERIVLESERAEGGVELDAGGAGPAAGWGRYVAAVAAELAQLGRPPVGFAGRVRSDLPIGAGLSSSAALEVAVAVALCAVAGFELEPLELALACQRAELRAVGVPCGILDQGSAVLGRAGHAILLDTASLEHEAIALPPDVELVVVDSGVAHSHEDSGYALRRQELEAGLAVLGGRSPRDLSLAEVESRLNGAQLRRVRHVVSENVRVAEVAAVLREPGLPRVDWLGALFREGHESLRDDFEVSTAELDLLVELAYDAGAVAARMTGGGFGGSVVVLAGADRAAAVADAVTAGYGARTGRTATALRCQAADGARELR